MALEGSDTSLHRQARFENPRFPNLKLRNEGKRRESANREKKNERGERWRRHLLPEIKEEEGRRGDRPREKTERESVEG